MYQTRNISWHSEYSCPEDVEMFDYEQAAASTVNGANGAANQPAFDDPMKSGFQNSYFKPEVLQRPFPGDGSQSSSLELHSLPELALFSDWETTLMMTPSSLASTKSSYMIYSAQYAKVLNRYSQYINNLKQQIASVQQAFQSALVDGTFDQLMQNPKNDEDVEAVAAKFFVTLYKAIERTKVLLRDELQSYFIQERLSLLKLQDHNRNTMLGQEYDFLRVPTVAYARRLVLQERVIKTLMAHMEFTALTHIKLSQDLYRNRLSREL